ncbi:MAG: hypothetical protein HQ551_08120 [Desulfobacteraceae bacterium]|nr:hypothetical protein [Desulfobacteraceae bacterium]
MALHDCSISSRNIRKWRNKTSYGLVPKKVKAAVWFSTNPIWEETANKKYLDSDGNIHSGTKEITHIIGGGLLRIEVFPEAAPYDWEDYKRKSGDKKRMLKGLDTVARKMGADPEEWRVSFKPVPREKWITVEVWDSISKKWVDFMEAYTKAEKAAKRKEILN